LVVLSLQRIRERFSVWHDFRSRYKGTGVQIVPDIRRVKTASKYPLKLRITHKGVRKYYATGLDVSDQQWEDHQQPGSKGKFQKMRIEMAEIEKKTPECVGRIVPFSFAVLEREFFRIAPGEQTLEIAYDNYIAELCANEQFGSANSYWNSKSTLKRFRPGKVRLEDVTKEFLNDFEK
jgi:integrase/recombinase XerD